jgi:hypothetical protein
LKFPDPHPGLVISYAYLWSDEHERGREEGAKDRPCAIVIARRTAQEGGSKDKTIVTVVPITHTSPADPKAAMEIPPALKDHLGLDAKRSWIVLGETNEFLWPGPDLRPIARSRPNEFAYGSLPPKFFLRMRTRLLELARERRVRRIARAD